MLVRRELETELRSLGVMSIVVGVFGALLAGLVFGFYGEETLGSGYFSFGEIIVSGALVWMLVLGIPYVLTGIGLMRLRPWARTLATIVFTCGIVCVPFGTALGLYGLKLLMSSEADALFSPRFQR